MTHQHVRDAASANVFPLFVLTWIVKNIHMEHLVDKNIRMISNLKVENLKMKRKLEKESYITPNNNHF